MEIFSAKIVEINISNWEWIIAMLNSKQAAEFWISSNDKISLIRKWEEYVVDVALTDDLVEPGTIWATSELFREYPIAVGDNVLVSFVRSNPLSLQAIKKKLLGKRITKEEIDAIIEDIQNNKLSDLSLAYYTATWFFYKSNAEELAYTTKATAYTWDIYRFPWIVASKYCIWGVSWNETTMIIVPLLASLWIIMPKTFSKSITSPAATGECVEILMNTELKKHEIIRLVENIWCCLAWNWNLNLAPANDRIIKVSSAIGMEPYSRMISSIMAKNYAMWINHCLIDIPVWPTAKVTNQLDAKRIAKHFKEIWEYLDIKTEVVITNANQPIWNGIGPVLQTREALRVLQQHKERAEDLEKKSLDLSAQMLLLCWIENNYQQAYKRVKNQLINWEAWNKMQQIIKAQKGKNPKISSEDLPLGKVVYEVKSSKEWKISSINMQYLNTIARTLWSPWDISAWIEILKKLNKKVREGETLMICYSNSENKMEIAKELLELKIPYEIK